MMGEINNSSPASIHHLHSFCTFIHFPFSSFKFILLSHSRRQPSNIFACASPTILGRIRIQKCDRLTNRLIDRPSNTVRCGVACPRLKTFRLRSSSPDQGNYLIQLFKKAWLVQRVERRHAYIYNTIKFYINMKVSV